MVAFIGFYFIPLHGLMNINEKITMKRFFYAMVGLLVSMQTMADVFVTTGNGTTWTIGKLLEESSAFELTANGEIVMHDDVTIAEADSFAICPGDELWMSDKVRLTVLGGCSFDAGEEGASINAWGDSDKPFGLWIEGEHRVKMNNITFRGAGLSAHVKEGMDIMNCQFLDHNAVSASYALSLGPDMSSYHVSNCSFSNCQRSAIGSGANICVSMVVENCTFDCNGVSNRNYPQLNLTVGENVVIRNNVIQGDRAHTMVGGIVVANLMGFAGTFHTLIENNVIENNRFGVATYVGQEAVIRGNMIRNNNTEVNPMNGGSGINVYDPYMVQTTRIEDNWIEGNLWGITVVGGAEVNVGKTADPAAADYNPGNNTFYNNGFDGAIYDLYNNSSNTVYAQGNYWKTAATQDANGIEAVVFHMNDDAKLGEVIFSDWKTEDHTAVEHVEDDATLTEVYSLNGVRLDGMQKGVNIVRSNGKMKKIVR